MAAAGPARPVPPPRQRETYQGEFLDDLRHGKGTCTFADGAVYTGEWRVGAPHGTGRFVYASGDDRRLRRRALSLCLQGESSINNRRRERGKALGREQQRLRRREVADGGGRNFPLLSPLSRREVAAKPVKRAAFA